MPGGTCSSEEVKSPIALTVKVTQVSCAFEAMEKRCCCSEKGLVFSVNQASSPGFECDALAWRRRQGDGAAAGAKRQGGDESPASASAAFSYTFCLTSRRDAARPPASGLTLWTR